MEIEHWNPELGEACESKLRKRLEEEGYRVIRYDYPAATVFPAHHHSDDKVDAVIRGTFLIRAEGRDFVLQAGDALRIPKGVTHSAEVLGDDVVVSLDATR